MLLPPLIRFLDRRCKPHLQQMQHGAIDDTTSYRLEKFGMRKNIEIAGKICIDDLNITSTAAPIATGRSDPVPGWDLHPLKINAFHGALITGSKLSGPLKPHKVLELLIRLDP
jgi:hypothetical protein